MSHKEGHPLLPEWVLRRGLLSEANHLAMDATNIEPNCTHESPESQVCCLTGRHISHLSRMI